MRRLKAGCIGTYFFVFIIAHGSSSIMIIIIRRRRTIRTDAVKTFAVVHHRHYYYYVVVVVVVQCCSFVYFFVLDFHFLLIGETNVSTLWPSKLYAGFVGYSLCHKMHQHFNTEAIPLGMFARPLEKM